jgi:hypothetical protein
MARTPRPAESYAATAKEAAAAEARRRRQPAGDDEGKSLFKQWEKLKKEADKRRNPWVSVWQEIYSYTMPLREGFFSEAPGQDRSDLIYDETAVIAVPKLASRLASGYMPEYGEIFSLELGPDAPLHLQNADGEAKLAELTRMIHESWQNSNMGIEVGEGMIDLAIGTMNLLLEQGHWPGEVFFTSLDPTGVALLPDGRGGVKGRFWWRRIALEDVRTCYPQATFSAEIERVLKKEPRREVKVECATWRMSGEPGSEKHQFLVVLPEFREHGAVVYSRVDEGEGSCPAVTVRWNKTGRDVWGRGPIQLTMPAIKTCNLTVQMTLENAEFAIGGMWTYDDDGVFDPDSVTFAPGTFIPKSREGKIEPLQSGAQFDVSELVLDKMQMNIKRGLLVDEMDSPGDTPYSAYEVSQRRADNARDIATPGSRITHEGIANLVNRTIWIFERQGILDSIGLRVDGKRLKLHPKSPFLRGQDAVFMQEVMQAAGQINAIFGAGTSGMMFRLEETGAEVFRRNGVPLRLKNTPDDLKALGSQAGAAAGQAMGPGGPGAGGDPMALLAPLMKAGGQ